MTGRALRRLAAPALIAAVLGGCATGAPGGGDGTDAATTAAEAARAPSRARAATPTATATPTPREQLDALLGRRSAALEDGDPRALAATAAGPGQRARDRVAARRAAPLPLRSVRYELERVALEGDRATLRVRSTYRLEGVQGRQAARRTLRARRRGGDWRITRETLGSERHPWEIAPFRARRTPRFLVLAPAGIDAARVGERLEAARRLAERQLDIARLRSRLLVVIAADDAQARALTERIRGVERLAAITDAEVRTTGPARKVARVNAVRLLIPWQRFTATDGDGQVRVVAHELTHAALVRETSGRTPAWLQEGIALYASGDDRIKDAAAMLGDRGLLGMAARGGLSLRRLARPDSIARLDGAALGAAYAYSSAAAYYIADRYGERGLRRLYRVFNDEAVKGAPGPAVVDAALREALGVSARRFERDLRAWVA